MPRAAIVGPGGFIGAAVRAELETRGYEAVPLERGSDAASVPHCNIAFFCAGSSAAHLSSKDPMRCLRANVIDLYGYLSALKVDRWVLMSSLSVYPADLARKSEDAPVDVSALSVYGMHKAVAETYVRTFTPNAVVLRVGYLYGKGLRKNLIFDLRTGRKELFLTADSVVAPLDVALLADAAVSLAEKASPGTYNVASRYALTAAEIAMLKGGGVSFLGERHIDERGVVLDRLRTYWTQPQSRTEHIDSIRSYLEGLV